MFDRVRRPAGRVTTRTGGSVCSELARASRNACVALAIALWSYSAAPAASVLRARLNSDIASLDPGMKRDENTDAVLLHLVEGLVASREDGSVAPMLASGWTVSRDGRVYRFALREGILFHNGSVLTSAEAAWSLKRYFDPHSHWRCRSDFGPHGIAQVVAVDALDRFTLSVRLDRPAPLFLKTLARADCGGTGILHPSSVDSEGKMRLPIGTGPFKIAEWRHNEFVELARFSAYRSLPGPRDGNAGGKHALVDRVRFLVIPDGSAASAALLRGSLDVLDNLPANELGSVHGASGVRMEIAPTMDLYGLLFQTRDPILADVGIRRAIALSLDVRALTRVATHGTAIPNSSPIPTSSSYHRGVEQPLIAQDLQRARALVRAAGYKGQPIELITNRRYPQAFDSAIIIQAMARAVGLNMQIVTLDWATQLARYARGDYQTMLFGYSARLDPSFTLDPLIGEKSADPRKLWASPAAVTLLARSREVGDAAGRQAIFDALELRFRTDQPAVILFNSSRVAAVRDRVVGYRSWAGATQRLWNVGLR